MKRSLKAGDVAAAHDLMDKLKDNGVYVYIAGEKPTNPKVGNSL